MYVVVVLYSIILVCRKHILVHEMWHSVIHNGCLISQKILMQERQNSSLLRGKQRQKELDMINEIRSVKEILSNSKQCPSCKMAISRTDGCNKMVCGQCGQYFCYLCGKAISGYEHFRGDGACQLFPEETIIQWEAQIIDPRVLGQNLAQVFAGNAQPCPNCRQMNAKVSLFFTRVL